MPVFLYPLRRFLLSQGHKQPRQKAPALTKNPLLNCYYCKQFIFLQRYETDRDEYRQDNSPVQKVQGSKAVGKAVERQTTFRSSQKSMQE